MPNPAPATPIADKPAPELAADLTAAQLAFCLAYLSNGFNATQAYLAAHPNASTGTAQVEGCRSLRNPKLLAFYGPRLEEAWKPFQMGGEQAAGRLAIIASGYDMDGNPVRVRDQILALRIMLELTRKISSLAGGIDELAAAIRADKEAHKEAMTA